MFARSRAKDPIRCPSGPRLCWLVQIRRLFPTVQSFQRHNSLRGSILSCREIGSLWNIASPELVVFRQFLHRYLQAADRNGRHISLRRSTQWASSVNIAMAHSSLTSPEAELIRVVQNNDAKHRKRLDPIPSIPAKASSHGCPLLHVDTNLFLIAAARYLLPFACEPAGGGASRFAGFSARLLEPVGLSRAMRDGEARALRPPGIRNSVC